jgi:hypothetical protein
MRAWRDSLSFAWILRGAKLRGVETRIGALAFLGLLLATTVAEPAAAQTATSQPAAARQAEVAAPGRYVGFVEFVAREDPPAGHTYIRYARFDGNGRPLRMKISGLYPKGGWAGKFLGGFVPVPASTTYVEEDLSAPITALYRRRLTAAQFAQLEAAVRDSHANFGYWNAFLHNCQAFVGRYAEAIGLTTPGITIIPADTYVTAIKELNEPSAR